MRKFLFLNSAQRFSDFTLLLLRVFLGLYLLGSAWSDISDAARTREYVNSLHIPAPHATRAIVGYLLLAIGTGFILGLFTRWSGILCAIIFAVTIAVVDRFNGMAGVFPSGCLVVVGLYLGTYGAGRFSVDAALRANDLPRPNGGVRFKV